MSGISKWPDIDQRSPHTTYTSSMHRRTPNKSRTLPSCLLDNAIPCLAVTTLRAWNSISGFARASSNFPQAQRRSTWSNSRVATTAVQRWTNMDSVISSGRSPSSGMVNCGASMAKCALRPHFLQSWYRSSRSTMGQRPVLNCSSSAAHTSEAVVAGLRFGDFVSLWLVPPVPPLVPPLVPPPLLPLECLLRRTHTDLLAACSPEPSASKSSPPLSAWPSPVPACGASRLEPGRSGAVPGSPRPARGMARDVLASPSASALPSSVCLPPPAILGGGDAAWLDPGRGECDARRTPRSPASPVPARRFCWLEAWSFSW
mmetsp:Transcript_11680/g.31418  ORF Transcript_11680/g.31418 Transcript_11680/m.31418 type:complete len:316 (+) Transcript_11680:514-1461(+)